MGYIEATWYFDKDKNIIIENASNINENRFIIVCGEAISTIIEEEKHSLREEFEEQIKKLKENNEGLNKLISKAKRYIIEDHLKKDFEKYENESLEFLLHLADLRKKDLEEQKKNEEAELKKQFKEEIRQELEQEKKEVEEDMEEDDEHLPQEILYNPINPESEEYIKSETCACGNLKKWGAKGCKKCKRDVDKIRKRFEIGMSEAWNSLWKSLGISK